MKKIIILFLIFIIGCSQTEIQENNQPTYSGGGCEVQAENLGDNYCEIVNGIRQCYTQEGF